MTRQKFGLFILKNLGKTFGNKNIGLYRDNGLAIIKSKSARLEDKTRKELYKIFEQFGLKITAEANLRVVNFLDVTFDLTSGKQKPTYQTALGHSNCTHKMEYIKDVSQHSPRNRQRNINWFNPPFTKNIKTNIARNFLNFVTHFPTGHKVYIIFNRNI